MNTVAYVLVVFGIILAKCFGFLRDMFFASSFGASGYTDIYFQVFGIASLVFTGIGSTLSTLIVKNLNKPENLGSENQKKYVSSFITKTTLILFGVTAVLYVFSGEIIKLLLPGLHEEHFLVALKIMYIMLPSCIFVTVAYIMCGVLQNSKVFFITSVMSLPYNAIIIAYLIFGKADIIFISVVTTLGWFSHILILLPAFIKKGYRLFGKIYGGEKSKRNFEVLYIFIGSIMFQLCFMADKAAVSFDSGMATTVNYASNLFLTVSSIFVVAMSNVSYPTICKHFEEGNLNYLKTFLQYIITVLVAIFVPFILTANLFGGDIISLLYERGEFTRELSEITAALFGVYTLGIFGYVCQELFNKVLYLNSGYTVPVAGTVGVVVLKLLVNFFIKDSAGPVAIAVTTVILLTLYAAVVTIALSRTIGNFFKKPLGMNLFKIFVSALGALAAYFIVPDIPFIIKLIICGGVYIALIFLTGCSKYIIKGGPGEK